MGRRLGLAAAALLLTAALAACTRAEPPKRYVLQGQILAVHPERQQLTIRHEDIVGFMPGMTMAFDVADPKLMAGQTPGDLVTAELEVRDSLGRLISIVKTGTAPLPEGTNEVAMAGNLLDVGDALPDVALIDQHDRRRSLGEWVGTPTLITFIYTRCPLPSFCPLMDQNFATIQRNAAEDAALRGRIRLVSISFDPDHDTPAVLAAHAAQRGADPAVWTYLTGDRVTIDRLAARFGVGVLRPDAPAEDIVHNLRTMLFDASGRVTRVYSGSDWTTSRVIADLRAVVAAR